MQNGNIGVTTDNIFPVIKKFLYSDHEIFLREVISNATDATQKLKTLASVGEFKGELGDLAIRVSIDVKNQTLTVSDRGIGMTAEEIDKYINQIAFSGAEEYLEKYKQDANAIIGHFGLGFYSSFMVSKQVDIITKSWKEGSESIKWSCDGSPAYTLDANDKPERGTDIVMHIDDENKEFLEEGRINELLRKYCKFMPIPIVFGKKKDWKDGKQVETEEDNQINNTQPAWTIKPADLKEEDYSKFYKELYPVSEDPLFHIHLNVDYPFKLTGILYFPKIRNNVDIQKNKIQLYCNQVFVTDSVEGIVPDFMTLLHGVIDSPDIPLNVSRSYLQNDSNVRKISNHITKKVADELNSIFKKDRKQYEGKWDDLKLFIEYGMLSDEKFCDRSKDFCLLKNVDGQYFTIDEYHKLITDNQTDKDGQIICLYASDKDAQYSYIDAAKSKGYEVLLMDGQLDVHFVGKLEQMYEKNHFVRVDSDVIENLIKKSEKDPIDLTQEQQDGLKKQFTDRLPVIEKTTFTVTLDKLGEQAMPVVLTINEFMRRMQEMAAMGSAYNFYGDMDTNYSMVLNVDNPLVKVLVDAAEGSDNTEKINQMIDLALLSNGMLKGEALTNFVKRSYNLIN